MNETTWERYGAASGLAFVVLFMLSVFIVPMPPHVDASTASVAAYFTSHAKALLLTEVLTAFSVMAFLWFLGHLRHVMQRAEAGHEELSPIVMVAGVALAGMAVVSAVPGSILAFMAHRGDAVTGATVRMMWDWNQVSVAFLTLTLGLFLMVASMAMVRKEMVAAWLGWAGVALAVVCWIDGIILFFQQAYSSFDNALGLVALLGFALWMAVASITMLQRPEADTPPWPKPRRSSAEGLNRGPVVTKPPANDSSAQVRCIWPARLNHSTRAGSGASAWWSAGPRRLCMNSSWAAFESQTSRTMSLSPMLAAT